MEQKVVLTREEYEELLAWKETAEIMSDPELMESIKRSEEEIARGETYFLSDLDPS
tara:strand:+ start:357 stop:524 length:168 start_codon:yes stop_codon:yes gene_type:complete